jgi:hypothetical protein
MWSMRKAVEQNARMAVGQMLGFDILQGRQLGLQPECEPRVLAASGSKSSGDDSQRALVFDHRDSSGHNTKQELPLRVIGVAGGDTQYQEVHHAMQTEVSDGARAISDASGSMGVLPRMTI